MAWRPWGLVLLFVAALSSSAITQPRTAPPPSVLIVTLDTTRADRLGCYGNAEGLTPALDDFSARSTVFLHCETPVPETVPAHTSLLSGLYPDRHGVRRNLEVSVPTGIPWLPAEFQKAGYRSAAFVSAFVLLGKYGFSRGFHTFDDSFYDPRNPEVIERRAGETLERARRWILEATEPWFCWIHLYDPHIPYDPPAPYSGLFRGRPYDGEIAYTAAELGKFMEGLEKAGKLRGTAVVICGDHGESLGEHGEETHGIFLYEATTRVPLIVHLPGQREGRQEEAAVSLVDVASTLRSLCGLPTVSSDGTSLQPALRGEAFTRSPLYQEALTGLHAYGWAPIYGWVHWPHKFILAPRRELYRLDKDPLERTNLFQAGDSQAAALEKRLKERLGKARPARTAANDLSEEELRSLRSLGYIAGEPGASGGSYKDPKDGIGLMKAHDRALELLKGGKYAEAAEAFHELVRKDPANPLFYYYLGNSLEPIQPEKAVGAYKKALQYRRTFPQAYVRLIYLLETQGRHREARDVAQLALREVEDDGQIGALLAWALFEMGSPESQVVEQLDRVANRGLENAWSLKLRALLQLRKGNEEQALRILEEMAAKSAPSEVASLAKDARFQTLKGEPRFWNLVIAAEKRVRQPKP